MSRLQQVALNESGFAFDPQTGDCYKLNSTASEIVQQFKQGKAVGEVAQALASQYGITKTQALEDIQDLLLQLKNFGLLR
ncbi:MAG: HPr-rel-A system PqqD family peptide chaperone [Bdellovibrionia bacterium]